MARPGQFANLSSDDFDYIGDLADRLESAWRTPRGQKGEVNLADFLPPPEHQLRAAALQELIRTDLNCRWKRGLRTRLDHYLAAFPELGGPAELPSGLVYEECRVRLLNHASTLDELLRDLSSRYPRQAETVRKQIEADNVVGDMTLIPQSSALPAALKPGLGSSYPPVGPEPTDKTPVVPPAPKAPSTGFPRGQSPPAPPDTGGPDNVGATAVPAGDVQSSAPPYAAGSAVPHQWGSPSGSQYSGPHGAPHGMVAEGVVLRGYRFVRELGKGQFGVVWLAIDLDGGYEKAVKIIQRSTSPQQAELENRAIELLRTLGARHPYLCGVEKHFEEAAQLFIVMERADCSLGDLWENEYGSGPVPADKLVRWTRTVAEGLDFLHQQGVVHRDIKPQNIMLFRDIGKVADFGLAKQMANRQLTNTRFAGTCKYSAPETFRSEVTTFCDQYSLAVTYAELRLGRYVFPKAQSFESVLYAHQHDKPDLTGLPAAEQAVLARALHKRHHKRYTTCVEFARALEGAVLGDGKTKTSYAGLWAVAAVVILAAVGLTGWAFWARSETLAAAVGHLEKGNIQEALAEIEKSPALVAPFRDGLKAAIRDKAVANMRAKIADARVSRNEAPVKDAEALRSAFPDDTEVILVEGDALALGVEQRLHEPNPASRLWVRLPEAHPEREALKKKLNGRWENLLAKAFPLGNEPGRKQQLEDALKFALDFKSFPNLAEQPESWATVAKRALQATTHLEETQFQQAFVELSSTDWPSDRAQALRDTLLSEVRDGWLKVLLKEPLPAGLGAHLDGLRAFSESLKDKPGETVVKDAPPKILAAVQKTANSMTVAKKFAELAEALGPHERDDAKDVLHDLHHAVRAGWLKSVKAEFREGGVPQKKQVLASLAKPLAYFGRAPELPKTKKDLRAELYKQMLEETRGELDAAKGAATKLKAVDRERRYTHVLGRLTEAQGFRDAAAPEEAKLEAELRRLLLQATYDVALDALRDRNFAVLDQKLEALRKGLERSLADNSLKAAARALETLALLSRDTALGDAERADLAGRLAALIASKDEPPHTKEIWDAAGQRALADGKFLEAARKPLVVAVETRYPYPKIEWRNELYPRLGLMKPVSDADRAKAEVNLALVKLNEGNKAEAFKILQAVNAQHLAGDADRLKKYFDHFIDLARELPLPRPALRRLREEAKKDYPSDGFPAWDGNWRAAFTKYLAKEALTFAPTAEAWQQRLRDCDDADPKAVVVRACRAECQLVLGEPPDKAWVNEPPSTAEEATSQYVSYVRARMTADDDPLKATATLVDLDRDGADWFVKQRKAAAAGVLQKGAAALRGGRLYKSPADAGEALGWFERSFRWSDVKPADREKVAPERRADLALAASFSPAADHRLAQALSAAQGVTKEDAVLLTLAEVHAADARAPVRSKELEPKQVREVLALSEAQLAEQEKAGAKDEDARRRHARLLAALGYYERETFEPDRAKALKLYSDAAQLDPQSVTAQLGLSCARADRDLDEWSKTDRHEQRAQWLQKLVASLQQAEKLAPPDRVAADESWPDLLLQQSKAQHQLGIDRYALGDAPEVFNKNFERALEDAQAARAKHPLPALADLWVGNAHEHLGLLGKVNKKENYQRARDAFQAAADAGYGRGRMALGRILSRMARDRGAGFDAPNNQLLAAAKAHLRAIAEGDTVDSPEAWYHMGGIAYGEERYEEAYNAYASAIQAGKRVGRPLHAGFAAAEGITWCVSYQFMTVFDRIKDRLQKGDEKAFAELQAVTDQVNRWCDDLEADLPWLKERVPVNAFRAAVRAARARADMYWRLLAAVAKDDAQRVGYIGAAKGEFERAYQRYFPPDELDDDQLETGVKYLLAWVDFCNANHGALKDVELVDKALLARMDRVVDEARRAVKRADLPGRDKVARRAGSEKLLHESLLHLAMIVYNDLTDSKDEKENSRTSGKLKAVLAPGQRGKYARLGVELFRPLQGKPSNFPKSHEFGWLLYETAADAREKALGIEAAIERAEADAVNDVERKALLKKYQQLKDEQQGKAAQPPQQP